MRPIGVLILVDEHMPEAPLVAFPNVGVGGEQLHREAEQIIERDGVGSSQCPAQLAIDRRHRFRERRLREGSILGGRDERRAGVGNAGRDGSRCPQLRRDLVPLHEAFDHGKRVVFVVDREGRRQAHERRVRAKEARTDRVEGADPHPRGLGAEQLRDARLHLAGGLVREGDGENLVWQRTAIADEPGDARRQHPCLPRPCSSEHQQRSGAVLHGLALRLIERGGAGVLMLRRDHP